MKLVAEHDLGFDVSFRGPQGEAHNPRSESKRPQNYVAEQPTVQTGRYPEHA